MRLIRFPFSVLIGFVRINPWLAVVIGMIVLVILNVASVRFPVAMLLTAIVQIVGLFIGLVLAGRIGRPTDSDPIVRSRVARRVCGACGYDLKLIVAESDGCAVCPECGAAWELPVVEEPAACAARL